MTPTSMEPDATNFYAMKGYELYSWQDKSSASNANLGEWRFSLLLGTNRLKTFAEITTTAPLNGIAELQQALSKLPRGSEIAWNTHGVNGLSMPPNSTVEQIKKICSDQGLQLYIAM